MKLKTLDDLNGETWETPDIDRIKQEAIKWIKELKDAAFEASIYNPVSVAGTHDVIIWIKHFFNITEKELKR